MIDNGYIRRIALEQSARDYGCCTEDFLRDNNVFINTPVGAEAKAFYDRDSVFRMISYGRNIVVNCPAELTEKVKKLLESDKHYYFFETPLVNELGSILNSCGLKTGYMSEYFLPDTDRLEDYSVPFETRILEKAELTDNLYQTEFGNNALCEKRKNLDMIGAGAYDNGRLVGLAACSADAPEMWQIGIDILKEYRRMGIAKTITTMLAKEIISRNKVPFYCAAWSNIASVRNAISCGFRPAWIELSAIKIN